MHLRIFVRQSVRKPVGRKFRPSTTTIFNQSQNSSKLSTDDLFCDWLKELKKDWIFSSHSLSGRLSYESTQVGMLEILGLNLNIIFFFQIQHWPVNFKLNSKLTNEVGERVEITMTMKSSQQIARNDVGQENPTCRR